MLGKVVFLVYLAAIIVGCLGGSIMKVDLAGAVKKKLGDFRFVFRVLLGGSLCVSGTL